MSIVDVFEKLGDPTIVTAWSTVVLMFATIVLAGLTGWLAIEQRKLRRESNAPDVVVSIEPAYTTILKVVVQNCGRGLAREIRISATPALVYQLDNRERFEFSNSSFFHPPFLRPGQKLERWLGRYGQIEPKKYQIKVSFRDTHGAKFEHVYSIDLEMYDRTSFAPDRLEEISKGLEKISDQLRRLGSDWRRLKVDVYSAEDREAEFAETIAETRQSEVDQSSQSSAKKDGNDDVRP
jgi:hypothetical protein